MAEVVKRLGGAEKNLQNFSVYQVQTRTVGNNQQLQAIELHCKQNSTLSTANFTKTYHVVQISVRPKEASSIVGKTQE